MVDIDSMIRQHDEIAEAMTEVIHALERGDAASNAAAIANGLADIATRIRDHLEIEDTIVYPLLLESPDETVRRNARQFQETMGGVATEFAAYRERYPSAAAIGRDPKLFSYETRRLFERVRHRMRREESDLYPLAAAAAKGR